MGAAGGNFSFWYETYTKKDRVTVLHEGKTVLDSGCVGANKRETLHFSGKQKEIVVNIEPNCAGTIGTSTSPTQFSLLLIPL